ncbi:MAG: hypothetical protein IKJ91_05555 [Clostridia bacterium]|nr:hypothetical protein [Clostridia bacterium]
MQKRISIRWIDIIMFFAFLAAMNAFDKYYYFTYAMFGLLCLKKSRKITVDILPLAMLLLLAFSWLFFAPGAAYSILGIIKTLTYFLCYLIGLSLIDDDIDYYRNKTPYKVFYMLIAVIALGLLAHYLLNWMSNASSYDGRNTVDIWTGEARAATGQAALACIPIGLAIALLFTKNNKWIKFLSVATLIIILGYNLILAGRTIIVMVLVVMIAAFIFSASKGKKEAVRLLLVVLLISGALILIYQANVLGVKSTVENSQLYERFFETDSAMSVTEDDRMDKKLYYLANFDKAIWGGNKLRDDRAFAHDILLDTYDEGGIFALIAMVVFLINSVVHLVKCVKDKSLSFLFRQIVLCVYIAVYMEFMVEPILQGVQWLFASFCMIDGYVSRILMYNDNLINKETVR